MLIAFLQRLVSLRTELGDFEISFEKRSPGNKIVSLSLRAADLPTVSSVRKVQVEVQKAACSVHDARETTGLIRATPLCEGLRS
jgi:hypothetical protein